MCMNSPAFGGNSAHVSTAGRFSPPPQNSLGTRLVAMRPPTVLKLHPLSPFGGGVWERDYDGSYINTLYSVATLYVHVPLLCPGKWMFLHFMGLQYKNYEFQESTIIII